MKALCPIARSWSVPSADRQLNTHTQQFCWEQNKNAEYIRVYSTYIHIHTYIYTHTYIHYTYTYIHYIYVYIHNLITNDETLNCVYRHLKMLPGTTLHYTLCGPFSWYCDYCGIFRGFSEGMAFRMGSHHEIPRTIKISCRFAFGEFHIEDSAGNSSSMVGFRDVPYSGANELSTPSHLLWGHIQVDPRSGEVLVKVLPACWTVKCWKVDENSCSLEAVGGLQRCGAGKI